MKNIIRDQKQTAETKIRLSPTGLDIVSANPKSRTKNQKSYEVRHLMSPNFALISPAPGCDDPPMILPSTIQPTPAHIFAVHLFASLRCPVRVGPLRPLRLIPVFRPFSKHFKPFQTLTFNPQIP
jgi:hypothetical protein